MFLLQMAGFPGSGKSTLSKEIARHINAVILDRDVIKSSMIESGVNGDIVADASYKVVFSLCKYYLGINQNVIIDTPCYYYGTVQNGINIAEEYKAKYKYIECKVDDFNVINHRLTSRESYISQIKSADEEKFIMAKDKSQKPTETEFLEVDSSLPIESYIQEVLMYLKK